MTELVEWLRKQLDEDAAKAQEAGGNWWFDQPAGLPDTYSLDLGRFHAPSVGLTDTAVLRPAEAEHIARHDPARVLAEVDAKRRIIEQYEASVRRNGPHLSKDLERILRLLALPYADRPGFKDEWRP